MNYSLSCEKELAFQADRRKATTEFIKLVSDLWYDKSIEIVLFKNQVIDKASFSGAKIMIDVNG